MVQIKDLPLPVTRIWLPSLNAKNLSETFSSSQRRPTFAFDMSDWARYEQSFSLRRWEVPPQCILHCNMPRLYLAPLQFAQQFFCVWWFHSSYHCRIAMWKKKKSCVTVNSSGCSVQCLRNITQQFCNAALAKGPLPIEQKHKCFLLVLSRTFMALGGPSMALL